MGRSKNTWRGSMGRPPFEVGDWVRPNGNYPYQGWKDRAPRRVEAVNYDEMSDRWTLEIKNPMSPYNGYSNYTPRNMELVSRPYRTEEPKVAYERKQWIGLKLDPSSNSVAAAIGEPLDNTPMLNSQHEVRVEVQKRIEAGDHWIVLETVAMIKGEDPRPPISITEYK